MNNLQDHHLEVIAEEKGLSLTNSLEGDSLRIVIQAEKGVVR